MPSSHLLVLARAHTGMRAGPKRAGPCPPLAWPAAVPRARGPAPRRHVKIIIVFIFNVTILIMSMPYYIILCCTIIYHTTMLYCTIKYYTILYYTILYYTLHY